jgi:hypothetical protein
VFVRTIRVKRRNALAILGVHYGFNGNGKGMELLSELNAFEFGVYMRWKPGVSSAREREVRYRYEMTSPRKA